MARKGSTKTRTRKKRTSSSRGKKNNSLVGSLSGALIILLTLTGMFQLGVLGSLVLGIYKMLVGQSYLLLMIIVLLYSLGLVIYNQLVHFRKNWVWGMIIFYSGLLLFLHSLMFQELNQHGHFFQVTWNNVGPVSYTHLTLPTNREV